MNRKWTSPFHKSPCSLLFQDLKRDRILQCTVERFLAVPVTLIVEQVAHVPKVVSLSRQNPATDSCSAVVELICETHAISLAEKISEQVVNTHVQHVVNTVKVVMPRIIKTTVRKDQPSRRSVPHQDREVVNFNRVASEVVFPPLHPDTLFQPRCIFL